MAHVVTQPCCNDASCVPVCPVNCIHPTPDEPDYARSEMLYIDPETCIDCGACIDVCPVEAIVPDYDLTDANLRFTEINARYFDEPGRRDYPPTPVEPANPKIETTEPGPLRVAIVGSGPAACYAAEELLTRRGLEVEVHMFERLPVPWGLVRFGVAPDHQSTKAVTKSFGRTITRKGLHLHLNVEVGTHVTHEELLASHHAVLYAVGAPRDRRLGVPGEDLPGSHAATEFVAWYNGHPDFADASFDLSAERAVVVGNGNVALDVARVLAGDVDELARTDIADHALEALSASRIQEVVVLGRRGPRDAAYTVPELLGLSTFDIAVEGADPSGSLKAELLRELADRPTRGGKRIVLRYLASPIEILGQDKVSGLRVGKNDVVDGQAVATGETEDLDCGLVLRSIGYRGAPLPGLPFDEARGVVPNDGGRVAAGVYAAGWIKRGPSGVIGTNKKCAEDTVAALLEDYLNGKLSRPSADAAAVRELVERRQPLALEHGGWRAIDTHEREAGRAQGRPRVKLVDVRAMLDVAVRTPG
ncbi:4Fe-4S dicluster domain-containing protein [Amycolatopsis acidicola]|uniref:ferredoxin--NADP(+) reductase n=1 Tax=Amycolatopsis acidicola TaxID=2596893 RepID=A0A5N0UVA9_9PSEU|nr:FAD-dependent oxidoreductase [Amycolatopsis acidicola]KAA9156756.1 4Fe-4S dicluster domain-containing protein [Amycolatopsis acidicola]